MSNSTNGEPQAALQDSGHMCATAQGGSIDRTDPTRAFSTLLRDAGLRRIRFRDNRHSTATLLLEQGVELVVSRNSSAAPTSDAASNETP